MKNELSRYLLVAGASIFVGLLLDRLVLCLLLGACCIIVWQAHRFKLLYDWVHRPNKNPMPYTTGAISDVTTAFARLRKNNRRRKKRLQQYMSQFRRGASALPDALVILDKQGRIEWMNETAKRYLGLDWPRDAQHRITNLVRHPNFTRLVNAVVENENTLPSEQSTTELPAPVDERLVLSTSMVPYARNLYLLIARDVTRLVDAYTIRKDFVANVSHELKTPLTVFKGYVELLQDNKALDARTQKAVSEMHIHSNRMHAIIEDLLFLSKLEHEPEPVDSGACNISELVAEIHDTGRSVSGEDKHLFKFDLDSGLSLKGSMHELRSAFTNLVVNAVKYTPAGGVIKLHWYEDGTGGHFEVIDNGPGIAARHLDRLTERFYRIDTDRSRDKGGTGLGLAIVKHVLQRHQARLTVESELQVGSTFRCSFPASRLVRQETDDTSKRA